MGLISLRLLSDGLEKHGWSQYDEKGVDFHVYKHLKMSRYSQINPKSYLKLDYLSRIV